MSTLTKRGSFQDPDTQYYFDALKPGLKYLAPLEKLILWFLGMAVAVGALVG